MALLSLALVALYLWAFSKPRSPLAYLVAGTLATVILLAAAFVEFAKRGYLRPAHHPGRGGSRAVRVSVKSSANRVDPPVAHPPARDAVVTVRVSTTPDRPEPPKVPSTSTPPELPD